MEESPSLLVRFLSELGLVSLYHSKPDVKLLCLQRFVRLFAYGASTLVLVLYLQSLGISKTRIGLFMTLTLVGDVCISFCLTLVADGLGRKAILALGALMMAGSGVAFAVSDNYWVLLAAAIFGVISPRYVMCTLQMQMQMQMHPVLFVLLHCAVPCTAVAMHAALSMCMYSSPMNYWRSVGVNQVALNLVVATRLVRFEPSRRALSPTSRSRPREAMSTLGTACLARLGQHLDSWPVDGLCSMFPPSSTGS